MVINSFKFFPVATGEDFRDLLLALAASPPDAPKPTKFDQFATSHPSVPAAFALASGTGRIGESHRNWDTLAPLRAAEGDPPVRDEVITREDLTTIEHEAIELHSGGHHHSEKFWLGFADYQINRDGNRWANGVDDEAFVHGWEAAMRVTINRKPWRSEYDWDDLDSLAQISGLRAVNKRQRAGREKLVGIIHARHQQLAARQPRLVVDNTE
jgi:hypothetical protein